jgi:hypothetical protein
MPAGRSRSSTPSPALMLAELEVRLDSFVGLNRPNSSTAGVALQHAV